MNADREAVRRRIVKAYLGSWALHGHAPRPREVVNSFAIARDWEAGDVGNADLHERMLALMQELDNAVIA